MTHNRHVFHVGFEYWRDRMNNFYSGNSGTLGAIIFNGAFTSSDPTNVTPAVGGYGGADFYLGLPSSYGKGISAGQWGHRANIFAGYIQDDWRATQNPPSTCVFVTRPTPRGFKHMTFRITSISSQDS